MITMEFFVPTHTEDLETKKAGAFFVRLLTNPEDVDDTCAVLDEVSDRLLNGDIFSAALDNMVFDPLYSFIKYVFSCLFDVCSSLASFLCLHHLQSLGNTQL